MKLNKKIFAVSGLAALAVVGATWAYFNQSTSITNPLSTGTYATSMVERFTPKTDWQPGVTVDKWVAAENTGDYDVLVRVKMDESWTRKSESKPFATIKSINGVPFTDVDAESLLAKQYDGKAFSEDGARDGLVPAYEAVSDDAAFDAQDHTVVYKNLDAANWEYHTDGYWYYRKVLPAATKDADGKAVASTTETPLMTAITLAKNVDTGKYTDGTLLDYAVTKEDDKSKIADDVWESSGLSSLTEIYDKKLSKEEKAEIDAGTKYLWSRSTSKTEDGREGYSDANYALNITTEFIQATKDAVESEWGTNLPVSGLLQ